MNVVVDTNIVFSGILSPKGIISDLLLNSSGIFEFYSPTSVIEELDNHHQRIIKLSGHLEEEINFLKRMIFKNFELISLDVIRYESWERAIELTMDVDEYDAPFIALSLELEAPLWTGDKKLIKGLKKKDYLNVVSTQELLEKRK